MHILTNEGFLAPSKTQGKEILLSSGLFKENKERYNNNLFSKKVRLTLATGNELVVEPDKKITGTIFEPGMIKNTLEHTPASNFKEEDYLFTRWLDVNYFPEEIDIDLTEYSPVQDKHRVYYISKSVYRDYGANGFTLINLLNVLTGKPVKDTIRDKVLVYLEENSISLEKPEEYISTLVKTCTKTLAPTLSINKRLMDYLIISTLRGQIEHYALKDLIFKSMSYKFNKDNEHHCSMYTNIILFLKGLDVEYEEKEYEHYFYVNFSCEPLINYYESFKVNCFRDMRKFSTLNCKYFLTTLYKYTNNSFYSNYDTYLTLKEYAYYSKIILGFTDKVHANYDTQLPINSFILEESPGLDPDVVILDDGYLTRIEKIKEEATQGEDDLFDNIMIIC